MNSHKVLGLLVLNAFLLANGSIADLQRIANGDTPHKGDIPYIVHLSRSYERDGHFCGGTIISHKWILTAAHCFEDKTIRNINITLGVIDVTDASEIGRQNVYVDIDRVHLHRDYEFIKDQKIVYKIVNDLALIELPRAIVFNKYIQPAQLPNSTHNISSYVNETAIAAGWGEVPIVNDFISSRKLQSIQVTVISNEECAHMNVMRGTGLVKDENICTVGHRWRETCTGDSGGPLVLNNNSSTLIGVTSFRPGTCGSPSVYTRVQYYLDWIHDITEGLNK